MTIYSRRIIFPEGDWQEAPVQLSLEDVVDVNGRPLPVPLPSPRMLAYRVFRISTRQEIGEEIRCYYLAQLTPGELSELS